MTRGPTGHYVPVPSSGEPCRAFVPRLLPPEPPLSLDEGPHNLLARANLALGRLDGLTRVLPDPAVFVYSYVRKEAVLSSQIEGTQSSFSDLLLFESDAVPGVPLDDVREVSNYVGATTKGMEMLKEGYPVCIRMIREMHAVLLSKGRGSRKEPGEFRKTQNWIGGSRPGNVAFVPPPTDHVAECMSDLEKFINRESEMPLLVKVALAHVQFETIHPFLNGNGRVGRLLITLILCAQDGLSEPSLYLSLFLKQNRQRYYELLQLVRKEGDWEAWLRFFLEGVEQTAQQAAATAHRLLQVAKEDELRVHSIGKAAGTALRLLRLLEARPILPVSVAAAELKLSFPAVNKSVAHLRKLNIVDEITGRSRNRLFAYRACLDILSEGMDD